MCIGMLVFQHEEKILKATWMLPVVCTELAIFLKMFSEASCGYWEDQIKLE